MAFGVLLTIASLFADPLALGMPGTGFGWKQMLGTLLGLVIAGLGGLVLYRTAQADAADADKEEEDESA
ncbi:hypothetical protein BH20CHL1_BH20CHL1_07000 [soil metagenome]|nr:hypothetical protein [Chloroflexia bacterium]